VRFKRYWKGIERRRIIGLLPISKRFFLSRMIFTAVCCDRCVFNTSFVERPDFMEGIKKQKGKQMSIWWFVLILGIWILFQAYILPKLGIST
jgi:hypothetical protein